MLAKTYCVDRTALKGGKGFTLIEALVAVVLVGLGAVAIIMAAGSGTKVNHASRDMTQASFLAQELREWTVRLPVDDPNSTNDLTAMDGITYAPPRDGGGNVVPDMSDWSQEVVVTWRNPSDLNTVVADGASYVVYVEVTVKQGAHEVLTTGWIIADRS